MQIEAFLADRYGNILTTFQPLVSSVTWALNEIGKADFFVSRNSPAFEEEYLQIGNRVFFRFSNGLPPWAGVIALPRGWTQSGVNLTAYTVEYVFKTRYTGRNAAFYRYLAGTIFRFLLEHEEDKDPIGLRRGSIWQGGAPHNPIYHHEAVWTVLTDSIRKMERCDFIFDPFIEDNKVKFKYNLYNEAGDDKSNQRMLVEGRNISTDLLLEEQGEVVNVHYAIGAGATWGPDRPIRVGRVPESVAKYGLRESARVYGGHESLYTLQMFTQNVLETKSEPRAIFTLTSLDKEPAKFATYRLGDKIRCVLPSFRTTGFDNTIRIKAISFNPNTNTCRLAVEVPNDPTYWIYEEPKEDS